MVLDADRPVLIRRTTKAGETRVGSGLRVGAGLVLTAHHVTADHDRLEVVVLDGDSHPATVVADSGTTDIDVTLLRVDACADDPPLPVGRLDRSQVGVVGGCVAVGFARWKKHPVTGDRVAAQVTGGVPTVEGIAPTGTGTPLATLKVQGPAGAPPTELGDLAGSGWAGMSGAVVVGPGGHVMGVVRSHNQAEDPNSLTITPLDGIVDLPGELSARFWDELDVDVDGLRLLPDADHTSMLSGLSPSGRPYLVREVPSLRLFGVRPARRDIDRRGDEFYPYVPWHGHHAASDALNRLVAGEDRRLVLLVGEPMVGKSRTGAEVILRHPQLQARRLLLPRQTDSLETLQQLAGPGAVLWIDDIDRHVQAINAGLLARWAATPGLVVVATIRRPRLAALGDDPDKQIPWQVLNDPALVDQVTLAEEWTDQDIEGLSGAPEQVRSRVDEGWSLGQVLGAADELRNRRATADDPPRVLVDLIADWQRTGLHAMPREVAARLWPGLLSKKDRRLLAQAPADVTDQAFTDALAWARTPILDTDIALVTTMTDGLVVDDYIEGLRDRDGQPVSDVVWRAALEHAAVDGPEQRLSVGVAAATADPPRPSIARRALEGDAEAGDTVAQFNLGVLLAVGWDPPQLEEARRWYERAAQAGHTVAQNNLGALLAFRWDPPQLEEGRRWCEQAAKAGHSGAQYNLALLLADWWDPPQLDEARTWYERAALAGVAYAQFNLGLLLAERLDQPLLEEARRWWTMAAEAGHTGAQNNLGLLLEDRLDPPELEEARRWYEQAAHAGHTDAQNSLGLLLEDRLDPPDLEEARRWYEQAAQAGHTDAQTNLGVLLATRWDPPQPEEARRWWTLAAEAGDTVAQFNLGLLLATEGDPPQLDEARRWWTQAAEAGQTGAQFNLGVLLATRIDPPELDQARHWWTQAAEAGHTEAAAALNELG